MSTPLIPKTTFKAIWQQSDWPNFKAQGLGVQDALLRARKKQGEVIGQANAIGLKGAQELIQSRYIQEIIATSAIEGEKLNLDSVRSSVFRKLGVVLANDIAPLDKKVDGLVDILQDALESREIDLDTEKLFQWHQALLRSQCIGIGVLQGGEPYLHVLDRHLFYRFVIWLASQFREYRSHIASRHMQQRHRRIVCVLIHRRLQAW